MVHTRIECTLLHNDSSSFIAIAICTQKFAFRTKYRTYLIPIRVN